jgi:small-conductance mechanosensitive channel
VALLLLLAGLVVSLTVGALLGRRQKRRPIQIADMPLHLEIWRAPLRLLIPIGLLRLGLPTLEFPEEFENGLAHAISLLLIFSIAWFARRSVSMLQSMLMERYPLEVEDNLDARRIMTQFRIASRIVTILIVVVAVATMLLTFDQVRELGVSLLASAGVAGIAIGLAAQNSLGMLLAGVQLAFSQPIRIDDVVIVEGEWGRIEEITLTYVVVAIWDQRRLIVPVTYFLETPFQNWTYSSAEILGTVYIYTDYTVPIEQVRSELKSILDNSPLWDGRAWSLIVTNATEKTVELRALVSAEDSSKQWDLRCLVRERLLTFLQQKYPESLPRLRLEMSNS